MEPAVTMLKPLHGDETGLYENLVSFCDQAYSGPVQIVFGVARQDDPAVAVVERLRREFPHKTIELVVDAAVHGTNPKVSNLINMSARIAHDIIVIADADIRVRPDYLSRIVGALEQRGGAVTCPVLRHLDRQSVVAARRDERRGALPRRRPGRLALWAVAAVPRLDHRAASEFAHRHRRLRGDRRLTSPTTTRSARLLAARGEPVSLLPFAVGHVCDEQIIRAILWRHELRWATTIRSIDPVGYAGWSRDPRASAGADRAAARRRGGRGRAGRLPRSPAAGF